MNKENRGGRARNGGAGLGDMEAVRWEFQTQNGQ